MKKKILMTLLAVMTAAAMSACSLGALKTGSASGASSAGAAAEAQQEEQADDGGESGEDQSADESADADTNASGEEQKDEEAEAAAVSASSDGETTDDASGADENADYDDGEEGSEESGSEEEEAGEEAPEGTWCKTAISTGEEGQSPVITNAHCEGGYLIIEGTYDEDGSVSSEGTHKFKLADDCSLGMQGGDADAQLVSPDEFDEILQMHVENKSGIGLVFYVYNDLVGEAWISS